MDYVVRLSLRVALKDTKSFIEIVLIKSSALTVSDVAHATFVYHTG